MSMLAERKRKIKWTLLPKSAPNKPLWMTETEGLKYGQKLMEKMGWSAGKGLGAKEQGIQEPLRVSYKNDTKGMGYKLNDDEWIEQQGEFNDLLTQLSTTFDGSVDSQNEKPKIKSLEEKSKRSKSRVHYQKFTRGKDLSRYSESDLACIVGVNKLKPDKNSSEEKPIPEINMESKVDNEQTFGVKTIHGGSLVDYFTSKWAELKQGGKKLPPRFSSSRRSTEFDNGGNGTDVVTVKKRKHSLMESEVHSEGDEKLAITKSQDDEMGFMSKHGKGIKKEKKIDLSGVEPVIGETWENIMRNTKGELVKNVTGNSQKKMKTECEKINSDGADSNGTSGFNPINLFSDGNDSLIKKEKKKSKIKKEGPKEDEETNLGVLEVINGDHLCESKGKKEKKATKIGESALEGGDKDENLSRKKKKKTSKEKIDNAPDLEESGVAVEGQTVTGNDKEAGCKMKKGKRTKNNVLENGENEEEETLEIEGDVEEGTCKKKKKHKKNKEDIVATDLYEKEEAALDENNLKKKKKKAKSEKKENIRNDDGTGIKDGIIEKIDNYEDDAKDDETSKKKKKTKKDKGSTEKRSSEVLVLMEEILPVEHGSREKTETNDEERENIKKKKKDKASKKGSDVEKVDETCIDVTNGNQEKLKKRKKKEAVENEEDAHKKGSDTKKHKSPMEDHNLNVEGEPSLTNGHVKGDSDVNNVIHTHKVSLLKKKIKVPENITNSKALKLYCGAEVDRFKGSNLADLEGYGNLLRRTEMPKALSTTS